MAGRNLVPPTLGQRGTAVLLDGLILIVPIAVLVGLDVHPPRAVGVAAGAAIQIIGVAVWGQTPGKRIIGTYVMPNLATTLEPPGWPVAIVRYTVAAGPALLPEPVGGVAGSLMVLVIVIGISTDRARRRGIHDRVAGTRVVQVSRS